MDWNKFRIRCSSLSSLFTEPQSKEDKAAGNLSAAAKKHLYKVYIQAMWGRCRDISTKQMAKGHAVEDQIIEIISIIDGVGYAKNEERRFNEWIEGECDVVGEDHIDDAKASWDAESFAPHIMEEIPKENLYQMQGYMWLWGKKKGKISRALVSCPEDILNKELEKLLYTTGAASTDSDVYKAAAAALIKNLVFEDIPPEQRIIRKEVKFDQDIIDLIPAKVTKAREFLAKMEKTHQMYDFTKQNPSINEVKLIKLK